MKTIILILLVCASSFSWAQPQKMNLLIELYQDKEYEEALELSEQILDDLSDSNSYPKIWYFRGYIFKDLFNRDQKTNIHSSLREQSIENFSTLLRVTDLSKLQYSGYREDSKKQLGYLISTIYNQIVNELSHDNFAYADEYSKMIFDIDKELELDHFSDEKLIDYYLYAAHRYKKVHDSLPDSFPKFRMRSDSLYQRVISIDQKVLAAQYNLGASYFNLAIAVMRAQGSCSSASSLELVQIKDRQELEESVGYIPYSYGCILRCPNQAAKESVEELMTTAAVHLEKAHEIAPNRLETVFGLTVAYFLTGSASQLRDLMENYPELIELF